MCIHATHIKLYYHKYYHLVLGYMPPKSLALSVYKYIIYIITRKFTFFSLFFSFKIQNWYYTSSEYLCSLQLIIYRNTIIIIYYLNCYYNWWELASETPYWYSMCCLRTFCVFFFDISLY